MQRPHRRSPGRSRDDDDGNPLRGVSFSTAVRTSARRGPVVLFPRIRCFLFMRLAMIPYTELATNTVEIDLPVCRRAP